MKQNVVNCGQKMFCQMLIKFGGVQMKNHTQRSFWKLYKCENCYSKTSVPQCTAKFMLFLGDVLIDVVNNNERLGTVTGKHKTVQKVTERYLHIFKVNWHEQVRTYNNIRAFESKNWKLNYPILSVHSRVIHEIPLLCNSNILVKYQRKTQCI